MNQLLKVLRDDYRAPVRIQNLRPKSHQFVDRERSLCRLRPKTGRPGSSSCHRHKQYLSQLHGLAGTGIAEAGSSKAEASKVTETDARSKVHHPYIHLCKYRESMSKWHAELKLAKRVSPKSVLQLSLVSDERLWDLLFFFKSLSWPIASRWIFSKLSTWISRAEDTAWC